MHEKRINIHFIYIVCILLAICILLASAWLFDVQKAAELISFAGTLISIVLAVLAIIITLIDISGQKNIIYDLKETSNELSEEVGELRLAIDKVNNLEKNLLGHINKVSNNYNVILKKINDLEEVYKKEGKDTEQLERLQEMKADIEKNYSNDGLFGWFDLGRNSDSIKMYEYKTSRKNNTEYYDDKDQMIKKRLKSTIEPKRKYKLDELYSEVKGICTRPELKKILNRLERNGDLKRDNQYYIFLENY